MVLKKANHERVKLLLKNTIVLLCKNGLDFNEKIDIECLIGLTLDDKDVVLMSLHEVINSDGSINIEEVESIRDEPTDDDGDSDPDYKTHKAKKSIAPSRSTQVATRSQQSQGPKRKRGRPPKYKKNTNDKAENANKQQEQAQTTPAQNIQIKEETLEENILTGDTSADVVMETAMFRELERLEASDPQVSAGVSVWSDILDNSAQPSQQSDADLTTVTSALSQESHEQDKSSEVFRANDQKVTDPGLCGMVIGEVVVTTIEDETTSATIVASVEEPELSERQLLFVEATEHHEGEQNPDGNVSVALNVDPISVKNVRGGSTENQTRCGETKAKNTLVVKQCKYPGCDYSSPYRSCMLRHEKKQHTFTMHSCEHCGKQYVEAYDLRMHVSSAHTRDGYMCKTCGKLLYSRGGLVRHERLHKTSRKGHTSTSPCLHQTSNEDVSDSEQRAAFTPVQGAETKDRIRHCAVAGCNFSSCYRSSMLRHKKRRHPTDGDTVYLCSLCDKTFLERYNLRCHMDTDHNNVRFPCEPCGKVFRRKSTLVFHQKNRCTRYLGVSHSTLL